MIAPSLIMQVPSFSTTEEKVRILVELREVMGRFISFSTGAESLNLNRESFLEPLSFMKIHYSYLDETDILMEKTLVTS